MANTVRVTDVEGSEDLLGGYFSVHEASWDGVGSQDGVSEGVEGVLTVSVPNVLFLFHKFNLSYYNFGLIFFYFIFLNFPI